MRWPFLQTILWVIARFWRPHAVLVQQRQTVAEIESAPISVVNVDIPTANDDDQVTDGIMNGFVFVPTRKERFAKQLLKELVMGVEKENLKPYGLFLQCIHASIISDLGHVRFSSMEQRVAKECMREFEFLHSDYHMLDITENWQIVQNCTDPQEMVVFLRTFVSDSGVDERFGKCIFDRVDAWIECAQRNHLPELAIKLEHYKDIEGLFMF